MNNNTNIESRRYIGSKAKLKDWIITNINKRCRGGVFADIFAGTGVIAAEAAKYYDIIILNDMLHSNYTIYEAYFRTGKYSESKISELIANYNNLNAENVKVRPKWRLK